MPSGGSKKQTVGYKYYLGCHMGLCHGPIDAITEIQVDKRVAWTGFVTEGTITVDAPTLFGGEKREGGVSGAITVEMGYPGQLPNAYLQSQLGSDVPAFRGVASLVFNQTYMGNNPYLKPWKFKAVRTDVTTKGEEQWNLAKSAISRGDDGCIDYITEFPAAGNFLRESDPETPSRIFPTGSGAYSLTPGSSFLSTNAWNAGLYYKPMFPDDVTSFCDFDANFVLCRDSTGSEQIYATGSNNDAYQTGVVLFKELTSGAKFPNGWVVINDLQTLTVFDDDSSPATSVNVIDCRIGIEVEPSNDRARIVFQITDVFNYSGDTQINGEWFDITGRGDGNGDFVCLVYEMSVSNYRVTPRTIINTEYNPTYDYDFSATVIFDGKTHTETLSITGELNGGTRPIDTFGLDPSSTREMSFIGGNANARIAAIYTGASSLDALSLCGSFKLDGDKSACEDMNPAHIIRECLTDNDWGMGYPASNLDELSFSLAADTLYEEKMGISILWEKEQPIEEFIGEILRHIDAVLYVSRATGRFVLKLIREETPTLTLDESNVSEVANARRPTISELTNTVAVTYWNAETDETASVTAHNEALRLVQGNEISTAVQYPGFTSKAIAARVAERDLKALSTPLLSCEVILLFLTGPTWKSTQPRCG